MRQLAVGVDLGGTFIKAALVSSESGIVTQLSCDTDAHRGPSVVLDRVASLVNELLTSEHANEIVGIGIGTPGVVNWERSSVSRPPNFKDWEIVFFGDELDSRLDKKLGCIVENDANAAGLGSAHYGVGRPFDSFIMITLGTGVGGSIIYNNRIFRGSTGGAGEIGHMTIDYEGPFARSGIAGAVEAYLGQHFLSRHARYKLMNRKDSLLHHMSNHDLREVTPNMIYDAAMKGDEGAIEVLAWAGHKLGCALGSAVNLLDIRKIVVGGGMSGAGDFILEPARKSIIHYVTPALLDDVEIVQEIGGNEMGLLGSAHLVFQSLNPPSDNEG